MTISCPPRDAPGRDQHWPRRSDVAQSVVATGSRRHDADHSFSRTNGSAGWLRWPFRSALSGKFRRNGRDDFRLMPGAGGLGTVDQSWPSRGRPVSLAGRHARITGVGTDGSEQECLPHCKVSCPWGFGPDRARGGTDAVATKTTPPQLDTAIG